MITFNNIYSTIVVDEKLRSTRSSHAMPAHQSVLFSEALFFSKIRPEAISTTSAALMRLVRQLLMI
jgi:hypothetical protein